MNAEIIKYDGCTYQCYLKQMKSRTGKVYPRAFCRREDIKCVPGKVPAVKPEVKPKRESTIVKPSPRDKVVAAEATTLAQKTADSLMAHLQPIPERRMSAREIFSLRTPPSTLSSKSYIGTGYFMVVKWFRPDLTAQLEKCYEKRPASQEPEKYEEAAANLLEKTYAADFKNRRWKPIGYLPKATKGAQIEVPFQSKGTKKVLLLDCQNLDLAIVEYRYLKAFLDICTKPIFGGRDNLSAIVVECLGNPIGLFMPVRPKPDMTEAERTALARELTQYFC